MNSFYEYLKDLGWIGPELALTVTALLVVLTDLFRRGRKSGWSLGLALLLTLGAGFFLNWLGGKATEVLGVPVNFRLEIIAVAVAYVVITMADVVLDEERWERMVPAIVVLVGGFLAGIYMINIWKEFSAHGEGFNVFGLELVDSFGLFFRSLSIVSLIVITLFTIGYPELKKGHAEFYLCLIGAHLGIMFLASSRHLLLIYLGLELLSLSSYLLAGFNKEDPKSAEAAVKYVIYGGVASGIMLFGFSLLYGFGHSMDIQAIGKAFLGTAQGANKVWIALGMVCTLAGLSYKVAAVPFHFWCPDVYEGSPTPVTAFLAVASKAGGFAVIVRMVTVMGMDPGWTGKVSALLAVASAFSMTLGNLAAMHQTSVKRLLAYSSIAHVGYVLMAVAALFGEAGGVGEPYKVDPLALKAILFYLAAYFVMNLGAFGSVIYIARSAGSDDLDDWWGLGWRLPYATGALVIFLLSLTGIPPTIGFYGKWLLFRTAIHGGLLWLVVIAALNTVVSLFYYFKIAKILVLKPAEEAERTTLRPAPLFTGLLLFLGLATIYLGVLPSTLM